MKTCGYIPKNSKFKCQNEATLPAKNPQFCSEHYNKCMNRTQQYQSICKDKDLTVCYPEELPNKNDTQQQKDEKLLHLKNKARQFRYCGLLRKKVNDRCYFDKIDPGHINAEYRALHRYHDCLSLVECDIGDYDECYNHHKQAIEYKKKTDELQKKFGKNYPDNDELIDHQKNITDYENRKKRNLLSEIELKEKIEKDRRDLELKKKQIKLNEYIKKVNRNIDEEYNLRTDALYENPIKNKSELLGWYLVYLVVRNKRDNDLKVIDIKKQVEEQIKIENSKTSKKIGPYISLVCSRLLKEQNQDKLLLELNRRLESFSAEMKHEFTLNTIKDIVSQKNLTDFMNKFIKYLTGLFPDDKNDLYELLAEYSCDDAVYFKKFKNNIEKARKEQQKRNQVMLFIVQMLNYSFQNKSMYSEDVDKLSENVRKTIFSFYPVYDSMPKIVKNELPIFASSLVKPNIEFLTEYYSTFSSLIQTYTINDIPFEFLDFMHMIGKMLKSNNIQIDESWKSMFIDIQPLSVDKKGQEDADKLLLIMEHLIEGKNPTMEEYEFAKSKLPNTTFDMEDTLFAIIVIYLYLSIDAVVVQNSNETRVNVLPYLVKYEKNTGENVFTFFYNTIKNNKEKFKKFDKIASDISSVIRITDNLIK